MAVLGSIATALAIIGGWYAISDRLRHGRICLTYGRSRLNPSSCLFLTFFNDGRKIQVRDIYVHSFGGDGNSAIEWLAQRSEVENWTLDPKPPCTADRHTRIEGEIPFPGASPPEDVVYEVCIELESGDVIRCSQDQVSTGETLVFGPKYLRLIGPLVVRRKLKSRIVSFLSSSTKL